jgi:hypothetical protein
MGNQVGFLELDGRIVDSAVCQSQSGHQYSPIRDELINQTDFSEMVEDINEKVSHLSYQYTATQLIPSTSKRGQQC